MINFPALRQNGCSDRIDSARLKDKIRDWGASVVGFGDVRMGLAPELAHLPHAVALGVRHPLNRGTFTHGPLTVYTNQYAEVDQTLELVQKKIVSFLKSRGWRTLAIPPDSGKAHGTFVSKLYALFPHKTAATCAGLGWIGKSGLLVSPLYGARLSWATVLTDAPLDLCPEPYTEGKCGNCRRCVKACPAAAIRDTQWVRGDRAEAFIDCQACSAYIHYTEKIFHQYICGMCMLACPMGHGKG